MSLGWCHAPRAEHPWGSRHMLPRVLSWGDAFSMEHPSSNGAEKFIFPVAVFPWKNTFEFALQILYNGFTPCFLGIFTGNNFDQPKYFTYLVSKNLRLFQLLDKNPDKCNQSQSFPAEMFSFDQKKKKRKEQIFIGKYTWLLHHTASPSQTGGDSAWIWASCSGHRSPGGHARTYLS